MQHFRLNKTSVMIMLLPLLLFANHTLAESLTNSQLNAVRSAKSYLDTQSFSKRGLIDQLSSRVGSGYTVHEATVAVDSLHIDWEKEAVRSAKSFLDTQSFSKRGLIDQLSSRAGSGYTVHEATMAVDSLHVDWNKEAARSARDYLEIARLSCRRLINQLSSRAGSGYTVSQADYGAQKAGACK